MLTLAISLLALAGCGGSSTSTSTSTSASTPTSSTPATTHSTASAATVQISTKTLPGLGPVLVNAQGRTLYIFVPDNHAKVTCVHECAQLWPPTKLTNSPKPTAAGEAKSSLLGSDPDPEGGRVVTYAGWSLYTYAADSGPGSAGGQGLDSYGGLWYVLSPAGKVIEKAS